MKGFFIFVATAMSLVLAVPVFAAFNGDIPDTGTHYNLNIIGVPKGKKVDMKNTDRHTIFVPLNAEGTVDPKTVKISYQIGPDFQVLDGNAFDADGALIQVPYEYCTDYTNGCQDMLGYNVYAVALGKPSGAALVEAHCTYDTTVVDTNGTTGLTCEDTLLMDHFDIKRDTGKPTVVPITKIFQASGCLDLNGSGVCDSGDLTFSNIWIFNIEQLTRLLELY